MLVYEYSGCVLPALGGFTGSQTLSLWESRASSRWSLVAVKRSLRFEAATTAVNRGPGIYNTSLPGHHKALMLIILMPVTYIQMSSICRS